MLLYCKECPNLDFKDMEETDKPICLKTVESSNIFIIVFNVIIRSYSFIFKL